MIDWIKERGRTLALIGTVVAVGALVLDALYDIRSSQNAQQEALILLGEELRTEIRENREEQRIDLRETREEQRIDLRETREELRTEIRENREEQRIENRETREDLLDEIRENRDAINALSGEVNDGFEQADERIYNSQRDADRRIDAANRRIDDANERADDLSEQIHIRNNPPDDESAPVEEDTEG